MFSVGRPHKQCVGEGGIERRRDDFMSCFFPFTQTRRHLWKSTGEANQTKDSRAGFGSFFVFLWNFFFSSSVGPGRIVTAALTLLE